MSDKIEPGFVWGSGRATHTPKTPSGWILGFLVPMAATPITMAAGAVVASVKAVEGKPFMESMTDVLDSSCEALTRVSVAFGDRHHDTITTTVIRTAVSGVAGAVMSTKGTARKP